MFDTQLMPLKHTSRKVRAFKVQMEFQKRKEKGNKNRTPLEIKIIL